MRTKKGPCGTFNVPAPPTHQKIRGESACSGQKIRGESTRSRQKIRGKSACSGQKIRGESTRSRQKIRGESACSGQKIRGESAPSGKTILARFARRRALRALPARSLRSLRRARDSTPLAGGCSLAAFAAPEARGSALVPRTSQRASSAAAGVPPFCMARLSASLRSGFLWRECATGGRPIGPIAEPSWNHAPIERFSQYFAVRLWNVSLAGGGIRVASLRFYPTLSLINI